ncbi:hypothetical protein [Bacillus alveayuensis]|jgi:hypothetical protein|uniref:YfhD family protein n=1 Tax=Aeribacillus alveayuensis TaxID=279215 RepID=A0ABT9VP89_9BACI|nr:hypothetical protein [Bacillus alveayuensis]MDQ0162802.1 hypothetical protein [Bacillus alveayuensis]
MGRTKQGNANAQRNNNAKKKNELNQPFPSYAAREVEKMSSDQKEEE